MKRGLDFDLEFAGLDPGVLESAGLELAGSIISSHTGPPTHEAQQDRIRRGLRFVQRRLCLDARAHKCPRSFDDLLNYRRSPIIPRSLTPT